MMLLTVITPMMLLTNNVMSVTCLQKSVGLHPQHDTRMLFLSQKSSQAGNISDGMFLDSSRPENTSPVTHNDTFKRNVKRTRDISEVIRKQCFYEVKP